MRTIATAALLFLLAAKGSADETVEKVAICDLLRHPAQWNGKMIEVTGPILSVQNYWVMGVGCDGILNVNGTTFLSGFVLQYPSNRSLYYHKVNFDWDKESNDELDFMVAEAGRRKQRALATVVGMFETRVPISGLIDADASYKYRGFGHMSVALARL